MTIADWYERARARDWLIRIVVLLLAALPAISFAQSIQLTPAQQQMLNSLPPAQRQQAMSALQQLQAQQPATTIQSINEVDDAVFASVLEQSSADMLVEEEPRADSRSRLVLNFTPTDSLSAGDLRELRSDPVSQRLIGSHLFVLDDAGVLSLQGLELIPLLGLNEEDIQSRLQAEPFLARFDINVRILGQEPIGVEALEPFGYDVFEPRDASFEPPSTGPVPPDYVLGPGDSVRVQLFGNVNGIYEYEVSRDGILNLPEIGPVTVAGIPFSEFRADLNERVQEMLIGTQVSVTMGQLRTIRVFVLGDANQPGSYVVNGLATMAGALYRSGGISRVGSLRDIQLKRDGRVVARLDLYDLLINGDTSGDQRLQPGDVIFVPPVGDTVAVGGAVNRPAIYETLANTPVAEVVRIAGGLANEAFGAGTRLERIEENGDRTVLSVNLNDDVAASAFVRAGDTLLVPEVLPDFNNVVVLAGHVYRPGNYSWWSGMRLTDLIGSSDELKVGVDMNYVLVRRERERGAPIEVVSANLGAALANKKSDENIRLEARDQVYVFSLELGRQRVVVPIVGELQLQATHDAPAMQVQIDGDVRVPGVYPLETGMHVSDLIRAGGSLAEEAYTLEAELVSYSVIGGESRVVDVVDIDLAAVLRGDSNADLALSPHDYVKISRVPEWATIWTVALEGEVRFPGNYRIKRGETLAEVLQRAGGLTDAAFAEGAIFLRESLREREQEQIQLLARRLEADLTALSLQRADTGGSETLTTGQALLNRLRTSEAVGRLVISTEHLNSITNGQRYAASLELRNGDRLLVPTTSQVVTILGETQQNTSHLFLPDVSRDDYINMSGGLTRRADKSRIYIVRANGAVVANNRSRWLGRGGNVEIRPGDTIVVPLDTDRMRPLTFWTNVTQILFQGAIAVAAIKTFDN